MTLTREQRKIQGAAAETRFRAWLERCHLPHIYVEQSPFTFPEHLKGAIKRPDFLVGIPSIGTLAVDVKAKRIYENAILIDADEHRTLSAFETYFNVSVWFACFPPSELHSCHLFLNRSLAGLPVSRVRAKDVIAVPLKLTRAADERPAAIVFAPPFLATILALPTNLFSSFIQWIIYAPVSKTPQT